MEDINMRIKTLRVQLHLSQVEFAHRIGVTNAHISKIEKGGTTPSEALLKLISKEYHVNEMWLKEGIEPMFIDEVESDTDAKMIKSTAIFNQLLTSNSYALRNMAAELNFYFASIADVADLDEKQKLAYLTIVRDMFMNINYFNSLIKDSLINHQGTVETVFNSEMERYKLDMNKCIEDYIRLLSE